MFILYWDNEAKTVRAMNGSGRSGAACTLDRVRADLGWAQLNSITAYQSFERSEYNDWDGTRFNESDVYFYNDIDAFSQELRLSSNDDGRLNWMVGAYSADESNDGGFYTQFRGADRTLINTPYQQNVEAFGVFTHNSYQLTDRLNLIAGLRYENETRSLTTSGTRRLSAPVGPETTYDTDLSEVSGRVGAEYDLADNAMLYASIARGVKSGGFTTYNSGLPEQLDPFKFEELIAYEAGVKSSFFDRKLQLNAAAFYYDYRDQQLQGVLYTQTGRVGRMINVPKSHIQGAELELRWRPLNNLTITQSVGYKYGEYDEFFFVNATATEAAKDPVTGEYNTIIYSDRAGERLPFPKWDYKGSVAYDWQIGGWGVEAESNYAYRDEKFSTSSNSIIASYWLVNANLTLRPANANYAVGLYVNNLTDSYSEESRNRFISASTGSPNPPRTWGVRVSYRY